jgi:hypothetical protein
MRSAWAAEGAVPKNKSAKTCPGNPKKSAYGNRGLDFPGCHERSRGLLAMRENHPLALNHWQKTRHWQLAIGKNQPLAVSH